MLAENTRDRKRERLTLSGSTRSCATAAMTAAMTLCGDMRLSGRRQHGKRRPVAAYVPLSFDPGEAYQFDWSHEIVLIDGVTTTVKVAHVRLCHSRMPFVRAYPRETQEMVFDAHDKAFAFFGGACARGIYDNMKTAVDAIFVGKDRAYNRRFQQMCGHYLVEPVACTPASGWEKGQVENQVGVHPPAVLRAAAEVQILCRTERLAGRIAVWRYAKANTSSGHAGQDASGTCSRKSARALFPYVGPFDGFHAVPGVGVQDLPRAVRQEPVLGRCPRGRAPR